MAKKSIKEIAAAAKKSIADATKVATTAVKTGAQNVGSTVKKDAQQVAAGVKGAGTKVAAAAKTVATKAVVASKVIAKQGDKLAGIALFGPLVPLAKIYLKRRNITPASKTTELITQVYNEMGKKSFGLTGDTFDSYNDQAPAVRTESYGFVLTAEMVIMVVGFLTSIFGAIKAKKAKGEALTAEEQEIANKSQEIEASLADAKAAATEIVADAKAAENKVQEEGAKSALSVLSGEGSGSSMKWIFIIIAALILVFFLVKKLR